MSAKPDLAVVVTFHREGLLAPSTLGSIARALEKLREAGFSYEAIFTLDRADDLTRGIVENWNGIEARILSLDVGDLARARNVATSQARGQFIAFMDGDDLYMSTWLSEAMKLATVTPGRFVWRPETILSFERYGMIWRPVELKKSEAALGLSTQTLWPVCCVIERTLAAAIPYPPLDNEFPFEDWAWNIALVEAGVTNRIVPRTGYGYRVKRRGSLLAASLAWPKHRRPTKFFRRLLEARIGCKAAALTRASPN